MDVKAFLIEKVAGPVLSGAGGVALTLWKVQKSLADRVTALEQAWVQFYNKDYPREKSETAKTAADATQTVHDDLDKATTEFRKGVEDLRQDVEGLRAELAEEVEELLKEIRSQLKSRVEGRRLQTRLSERYLSIEARVDQCEKSIASLNEQFQGFAREQNEHWQTMTRTLGQLEGYLRGISRGSSDSGKFPGTRT